MSMEYLKKTDDAVYKAIQAEEERERNKLLLIASENYASRAVMEAQGSVFTNKYAEGYPARRYYGGCEYADTVERLAVDRAKELFGADHVNVQPHSGSQANMAVYMAMLNPGDTILGMSLSHGGHLTHGASVNFSGKIFKSVSYGVRQDTGHIDYEEARKLALEMNPKMIVVGASAYSRIIDFQAFAEIAREVDAYLMADVAHIAGLIAAGEHPSPIPHADFVTTTTHKTLRGPRGGMIMCKADYAKAVDKMIFPGIQGGPLVQVIAAKAVAFKEALSPEFKQYQKNVVANAKVLAAGLVKRGFSIISGGTDNHLMLVDLTNLGVTGKDAEEALDRTGVTLNKNSVPFDKLSPMVTSGIRIGTPCVTSRGMGIAEMEEIADVISMVVQNINNPELLQQQSARVKTLCERFPIY